MIKPLNYTETHGTVKIFQCFSVIICDYLWPLYIISYTKSNITSGDNSAMKNKKPRIGIVMGSDSDFPVMEEALRVLDSFGVPYEVTISSAHRSPKRTGEYARTAVTRGLQIIIVGAGSAAHLAGVIAAETTLPVIGIPIDSSPLKGIDSLLSTVQMPGGVPVATMAIGKSGARNAALFAVQILSLRYAELRRKLINFKQAMETEVHKKAEELRKKLKIKT